MTKQGDIVRFRCEPKKPKIGVVASPAIVYGEPGFAIQVPGNDDDFFYIKEEDLIEIISEDEMHRSELIRRLRGTYNLPVNDGAGPLDGKMIYTRQFQTEDLQREAADMLERIEKGDMPYSFEVESMIDRLMVPADPMGIGHEYVVPIRAEAAAVLTTVLDQAE